ncbi:MAG: histidine--tRNA ligase [Dehalococcoidia bacterium]
MYKSPRGTVDILPEEQKYWRFIEKKAVEVSRLYGFERLDTPVFEDAQLFTRSIGEGTDIVTKEMYLFRDQSGNDLALRPEGTAPVCRSYVEHGMDNRVQPVKLYYFAAIFRYERPQAGRYRQHYQFGFEAIGEIAPSLDAEVIDMAWRLYESLGLKGLSLQLNSIGCRQCRPGYIEHLRTYYKEHVDRLCPDCKNRLEKNTLRLLDCKKTTCQEIADAAPKSSEHLCDECGTHFESVKDKMKILRLPFHVNHRLVRGLDYYTKTVFEIQPPEEGSQSAIGGGGRYDNLIEEIGGKPTPAVGFASGMERIILNLKRQNVNVPEVSTPVIFIAHMGDEARGKAVQLAADLRRNDVPVLTAHSDKSLKAQLRQANNLSVRYTAIIGEDEIKNNAVTLRDMSTSDQRTVPVNKLIELLVEG